MTRRSVVASLLLGSALTLSSGGQDPNGEVEPGQSPPRAVGTKSTADASELENPVAYTETSIKLGRRHYLRLCQSCHGYDGRALDNVDFEASDLTRPSMWLYGTTDGEIFVTIRYGAGQEMPPFEKQVDDEIWQLVNYIRSIGPEAARPPIVSEYD